MSITWLSPDWLWGLLAVPVAVAFVVLAWRGRTAAAARYADPQLLDLRPTPAQRGAWGLAATLGVLALAGGVLALARPALDVTDERERGAVVVAVDISNSMLKDDLAPDRLSAALDAARALVDVAPSELSIGFVTFADRATVRVNPTTDRDRVIAALAEPGETREGTSMTAAVETALASLRGSGVIDDALAPDADPGAPSAARIIMITDGANSIRPCPDVAAARARAARVPVYTVLLGNDAGHPRCGDPAENLSLVATQTGGIYTQSTDSADLALVFEDLGRSLTAEAALREVTVWVAAAALALLLFAGLALAAAPAARRAV